MSLSGTVAGYRNSRAMRKSPGRARRRRPVAVPPALLLALTLLLAPSTLAQQHHSEPRAQEPLTPELALWLDEVQFLITDEERDFFLSLKEDFRRFAFIDAFWAVRDPNIDTPYNEFKRRWDRRRDEAKSRFGGFEDARSKALLLHGPPGRFQLRDGRVLEICYDPRQELELWFYGGSERTEEWFPFVFYRPFGPRDAPYQVWDSLQRLDPAPRRKLPTTVASLLCAGEGMAIARAKMAEIINYPAWLFEQMSPPQPNSVEWIQNFAASSTMMPPAVALFEVDLSVEFPGRNQNRTAVSGVVEVPPLPPAEEGEAALPTHHFLLTGEVVRDGRLFERFHYRFEAPPGEGDEPTPLIFQRYLRPGEIELHLQDFKSDGR